MNKKYFAFYSLLILVTMTFISCKNEGCTDPLAINYFSNVEVDDGSCSYSTNRMVGDYNYIYDSTDYNAIVFPVDLSLMKVEGVFDHGVSNFYMVVDWTSRAMVLPDSAAPEYVRATGAILDKDNFRIDMFYNDTIMDVDTSYSLNFKRI